MKNVIILAGLLVLSIAGWGQTIIINGTIRDTEGELLPFASVLLLPDSILVLTDGKGKFSVKTHSGHKQLSITYTGYQPLQVGFFLRRDTSITVIPEQQAAQLKEVTIKSRRYSQTDWIETTRSGTNTLTKDEVSAIPVLGGEADVIKVLQLLPGTIRGVEGSSDLFVRGGAADQNLVLLDDAPIYNTSHLFGFLSVFSPEILQRVESVNGGFPAN